MVIDVTPLISIVLQDAQPLKTDVILWFPNALKTHFGMELTVSQPADNAQLDTRGMETLVFILEPLYLHVFLGLLGMAWLVSKTLTPFNLARLDITLMESIVCIYHLKLSILLVVLAGISTQQVLVAFNYHTIL